MVFIRGTSYLQLSENTTSSSYGFGGINSSKEHRILQLYVSSSRTCGALRGVAVPCDAACQLRIG